jgi:hypothetical protein
MFMDRNLSLMDVESQWACTVELLFKPVTKHPLHSLSDFPMLHFMNLNVSTCYISFIGQHVIPVIQMVFDCDQLFAHTFSLNIILRQLLSNQCVVMLPDSTVLLQKLVRGCF